MSVCQKISGIVFFLGFLKTESEKLSEMEWKKSKKKADIVFD